MSQTTLYESRRHDSDHLPSAASHSLSSFREVMKATAHNNGEKGNTRSLLEDKGIIRPNGGHKRKHADETGQSENHNGTSTTMNSHMAGSSLPKRRSPPFTGSNFKYSRSRERLLEEASKTFGNKPQFQIPEALRRNKLSAAKTDVVQPEFKTPEALRKYKRSASTSQIDDGAHEVTSSKKRRVEHPASSARTLGANITGPNGLSSATLSTGSSTPMNSSNRAAYNAKHWVTKSQAPSPSIPRCRPFDSTSSSHSVDRARTSSSNADGKRPASMPLNRAHSTLSKQREGPSGCAAEHINPNGTKVSRADSINVPTIARQIQYPPPDLDSLTRVLNQVPMILTDLNNKQTKLIRELAMRVNDQQKEFEALKSENDKLDERIYQTETNVAEYVEKRFAAMEEKYNSQIEALQAEVDQMAEHVDTTGERITAQVNNKIASISRIQGVTPTPTPAKGVVIDLQDEEEGVHEEATGLFTPHRSPQK